MQNPAFSKKAGFFVSESHSGGNPAQTDAAAFLFNRSEKQAPAGRVSEVVLNVEVNALVDLLDRFCLRDQKVEERAGANGDQTEEEGDAGNFENVLPPAAVEQFLHEGCPLL